MMLRELPPQSEIEPPRNREPCILVPANTWVCRFCAQPGGGTTVEWLGLPGHSGKCRECGQTYCLAAVSTPAAVIKWAAGETGTDR